MSGEGGGATSRTNITSIYPSLQLRELEDAFINVKVLLLLTRKREILPPFGLQDAFKGLFI